MLKKHELYDRTGRPVVCDSSNTRQLGCVFQDMELPKSSSILRKSSNMRKPIRCVRFTKAVARHAYIRDQNPSLGYICPGEPHQRSPNAPKFEDRSQEETEGQEQGAREAAWKLAKSVLKLKEKNRATFFSLSENRCLLASTFKLEEREFVVDSGASVHMISKKDLSKAEMDTLTKSCSPTIVIPANGEVQTHEEAIVYVKELDTFLTMKVLDNTPAVLSLGKLCDEHGYSYEWINGQKKKNISFKTGFEYNATRRTSFLSWFQACRRVRLPVLIIQLQGHLQDRRDIVLHLLQASSPTVTSSDDETREREDRTESDISPVPLSTNVDDRTWQLVVNHANTIPKTHKKEPKIERGNPLCSDIPEWLQEFRENLVDDEIPEDRGSHASSSHEVSLEPRLQRDVRILVNTVFIVISQRPKLRDLSKD